MAEIDERYKRGMIYTIRNIKDDAMIYVGSSINNLSKRFHKHKTDCKINKKYNLYSYIVDNDWDDWYIELYEAYPCNNKKQLNRREGQVIREIGTLNKKIEGRTYKEYREDNADKIKEYQKIYCENNREKRNENRKIYRENNKEKLKKQEKYQLCCNICGAFSLKHHLIRHQKSKKCMEVASKIPNNTDIPTDTHI